MRLGGLIFMLIAWGTIISLAAWSVKKVFFDAKKDRRPGGDRPAQEAGGHGEDGKLRNCGTGA